MNSKYSLHAGLLALFFTTTAPLALAQTAKQSFNPKVSLILQGSYAHYRSAEESQIPGFLLGPETEFRSEGFSLGESELVIEANVDDLFRGWATIAFEDESGDTEVALEEAYLETLRLPEVLPAGLGIKFGRFFSDIGYHNRQHGHAWDFADAPLPYRAMLAGHLADDGIQVRWLAPTDMFLEFGVEALRGIGFPAGGEDRSGVNTWTSFARAGGDWGTGGAWRLGYSYIKAQADGREVEEEDEPLHGFSGDSELHILDFVYKWSPNGNPRDRNFIFQAEYFDREEDGLVEDLQTADISDYSGAQSGYYLQAVYQFRPRWRVGLRFDQLDSSNRLNNPVANTILADLADDAGTPQRWSAMFDYSHSEFSRMRLQFNRDESRADGKTDDQIILQYIHSLGAHPAHQF